MFDDIAALENLPCLLKNRVLNLHKWTPSK
jgi:hypothetical protein